MTSFPPHSGGVDEETSRRSAFCTWHLLFGINKVNHNYHLLVLPVTTKSIDSPAPPPAVASILDDKPNVFPDVPHQNQSQSQNPTRDVEDSLSSDDDDGSTSDPFRQDSSVNENDVEDGKDHSEKDGDGIWRWSSFPRPGPDNHASWDTSTGKENKGYLDSLASGTTAPKTTFPAPSTGARTASSSSTDISQQSTRPGSLHDSAIGRHPSNTDTNSRALASRSANREKKPPPPPKNRHGRLINPPPQPPPPPSSVSSNRFSYHGTPSGISISHTPSTPSYSNKPSPQAGTDYFSPKSSENENINTSDTLRRSQSQYKRPPTPPLSRRHSQMSRSKSTLSKPNPNRLSMPVGKEGVNASPPPSPSTNSLTSSLRKSSMPTDENHLQAETSTMSNFQRTPSVRRTGQGTSSAVPPPPPPRRSRISNDGTRPTSVMLEKTREEDAFPHPSNANHILDDLSRLQKEVDDLRGRYESRKGSH